MYSITIVENENKMAKTKNLNGLPNNLIQQYFSTLFYYDKGYMADWIWNAANEKNVSDVQIDILNQTVIPQELQVKPIISQLRTLQQTIKKELSSNGLPDDYFVKATFEIYISPENNTQKIFACLAVLEDKDGKIYRSKPYAEMAYETSFQVFKPSLSERLNNIFTNKLNKT